MDLTFQVPMQYCSLQHQTLLPSPVTSTVRCCFHFGSVSSFFLELFLHSSPLHIGHLLTWRHQFHILFFFFLPFHTVHGVLKARILKWFAIYFPVDILSELSTMTCLSWVALHSMVHSFTELDKAVVHVITLVSFL